MVRLRHFVFDDQGQPRAADVEEWLRWWEHRWSTDGHVVALDVETVAGQEVRVSTVILPLTVSDDDEPPVLWETMVFGGRMNGYQRRYTSREHALQGHRQAVADVMDVTMLDVS